MTLDEKENSQDNTSEDVPGTSEKEPVTFTEEQVVEEKRKASSDSKAELGRVLKVNENLLKVNKTMTSRIERVIKDHDDEELAKAEGEPEKLSAIKERQARRRVESELADKEQELEEEKGKRQQAEDISGQYTKEQNAREIATRLGVDVKMLLKVSKHTDSSKEVMEEIAQELPKKDTKSPLKPDGSKTGGSSGGIPTNMEKFRTYIAGLSPSEFEVKATEINKMMKDGKIK